MNKVFCSFTGFSFSVYNFHIHMHIHIHIQSVSQLTHLSTNFSPLTHKSDSSPYPNTSGTLRFYYFSPTTSNLPQDQDQLIKTPCFAAYVPTKLIVEFNRIRQLPAPSRIVMHNNIKIKLAIAYLFIKLAMRKVLVAL